jgi:hypothetical protein
MKFFTSILCLTAVLASSFTAGAATTYIIGDNGIRYKADKKITSLTVTTPAKGSTYVGDYVIPATVKTENYGELPVVAVGSSAFSECDGLTSVILPESVKLIDNYAFDSCPKLKKVEMPGVTTIGHWSFRWCTALEDLVFPEGLTTIGNYAFDHLLKMTVIELPSTVTTLGGFVFEGNPQITKFICHAVTPPSIKKGQLDGDDIYTLFENTDYGDIELVVPEESVTAYKTALGWHYFTKITPASAGVGDIMAEEVEGETVYYDILGRAVANPQKGHLYIRQTNVGNTKVIY